MTEEIIIDGVDVAGCVQFVEDDNCCCDLGGDCKGWDNCYYKQLKRLEQENKELKELIGKTRYNRLEMYESFKTECNNYRSALEEINITVKQLLQGVSSNCINNTPYLTALSLIENKINEVLNEN